MRFFPTIMALVLAVSALPNKGTSTGDLMISADIAAESTALAKNIECNPKMLRGANRDGIKQCIKYLRNQREATCLAQRSMNTYCDFPEMRLEVWAAGLEERLAEQNEAPPYNHIPYQQGASCADVANGLAAILKTCSAGNDLDVSGTGPAMPNENFMLRVFAP
ncbi:hypothetical protein EJ05DRAFT_475853 [Pseudovirgaria hyperparasitica]|uniref:Secreted protein n=1 Tax=Pseudovirgaria hyperparasitica TaxID=470096 RepID=A0A6A6WBR3_9PEZI|nr:uncharacterized protein EJ05DRAFT_475853 [Pseudovirgaria hyperparasitica]KAF2758551.1 hypothetical protein EJ05DRAFT_475853 [Pseudovirgaria hyperparasitica]